MEYDLTYYDSTVHRFNQLHHGDTPTTTSEPADCMNDPPTKVKPREVSFSVQEAVRKSCFFTDQVS